MGGCAASMENIKPLLSPISNQRSIERKDFEMYEEAWNLSKRQILMALRLATKDQLFISRKHNVSDKMKCFLYAKDLLDEEAFMRNHCLKKIFGNRDDSTAFARLMRITETGETTIADLHSFEKFVEKHPEWEKGKSWVLFRDHPRLIGKDSFTERSQISALCFMHGAVIMQKYLVAMNSDEKVGMVDVADYLRKHADSQSLKNHIFFNSGGHSTEFLKNILQLPNHETFEKPDVKSLEIPQLMKQYGPALVSSMEIWSCFYDQSKYLHLGTPQGVFIGFHSLLIIGYRFHDGELRYLLQNFWMNKSFIEVNSNYLRSCGSIITFVTGKHTTIPSTFVTNFSRHVECSLDSMPDVMPLETSKKQSSLFW